jgi:oxygen-independent coproporphyrinogen-3 oxidase
MADRSPQWVQSLYVHVPFCAQKCSYCAFYSEGSRGELVNGFVEGLLRELALACGQMVCGSGHLPTRAALCQGTLADARGSGLKTVFFGGGTPSILNLRQWERILKAMEGLGLLGAQEWTIECNPATVSEEKGKLWRDYGVNRISMGVQSLDERLLDRLGRIHSREQVFKSYELLRRSGFTNVNLDLMFAVPGQTMEIWKRTLEEALALGSEHLSCYEVIYEEDTPLFAELQAGEFDVDEDLACAQYEELLERSAAAGFRQYEVANFAKGEGEVPEFACRHNVNYWRGGEYFGLGPSAAEYVGGVRSKNWSNTQLYCDQLLKGKRAVEWREALPALKRAGETAAFGLRMNAGWKWNFFEQATGFDLRLEWCNEISRLVEQGWGESDATGFRLTRQGLRFADAAAELFLR